jgi:hypothetical protein
MRVGLVVTPGYRCAHPGYGWPGLLAAAWNVEIVDYHRG